MGFALPPQGGPALWLVRARAVKKMDAGLCMRSCEPGPYVLLLGSFPNRLITERRIGADRQLIVPVQGVLLPVLLDMGLSRGVASWRATLCLGAGALDFGVIMRLSAQASALAVRAGAMSCPLAA